MITAEEPFVITHATGASGCINVGFRVGRQSIFGQFFDKGYVEYCLKFPQIVFPYLFDVPHPQPQESD